MQLLHVCMNQDRQQALNTEQVANQKHQQEMRILQQCMDERHQDTNSHIAAINERIDRVDLRVQTVEETASDWPRLQQTLPELKRDIATM